MFNELKTGDLLACQGTWPMSRAIQWLTDQDISHVGLVVNIKFNGNGDKIPCIFQSMEGRGVELLPLKEVLQTKYWPFGGKVYWQKCLLDGDKLAKFCLHRWGGEYANYYQFLVGLSPLLRFLRKLRGANLDTKKDGWHCSELIADGLADQGVTFYKDSALITPGDLSGFDVWGARVELTQDTCG